MITELTMPPDFDIKRRDSILATLDQLKSIGLISNELFSGHGLDVGCCSGTSCNILEQMGGNVTYVEKDPRYISAAKKSQFVL